MEVEKGPRDISLPHPSTDKVAHVAPRGYFSSLSPPLSASLSLSLSSFRFLRSVRGRRAILLALSPILFSPILPACQWRKDFGPLETRCSRIRRRLKAKEKLARQARSESNSRRRRRRSRRRRSSFPSRSFLPRSALFPSVRMPLRLSPSRACLRASHTDTRATARSLSTRTPRYRSRPGRYV